MKSLFSTILLCICVTNTYAQIGIKANNTPPIVSAQLEVQSINKAFYPPRMTTFQKGTIPSPQAGAIVYDTDLGALNFYNGSAWVVSGSGITLPYISSGVDVAQIYGLFRISETNSATGGSAIQGFSTNGSGLIGSSNNYRGVYGYSNNGTAGYFNSPSGYALITATGNVGIGIANPQEKLHVLGNVRVTALASSGNTQLYADAQGTLTGVAPVAFLAKQIGSPPTIANFNSLTFPFANEEYDLGGFFSTTNYEFSAPLNGIYHFDAFVTFGAVSSALSNSDYILSIEVDNVVSSFIQQPMTVTTEWRTLTINQDLKLNAGQKVKIVVNQTSGISMVLIGGQYNSKFSGHLVYRL